MKGVGLVGRIFEGLVLFLVGVSNLLAGLAIQAAHWGETPRMASIDPMMWFGLILVFVGIFWAVVGEKLICWLSGK
jgi:hypothetical protein